MFCKPYTPFLSLRQKEKNPKKYFTHCTHTYSLTSLTSLTQI